MEDLFTLYNPKKEAFTKSSIEENEESIFDDGWVQTIVWGKCVILRGWQKAFSSSSSSSSAFDSETETTSQPQPQLKRL